MPATVAVGGDLPAGSVGKAKGWRNRQTAETAAAG
jgi:hypothetical protein